MNERSEKELAALVVAWLVKEGWEVYQEVQIFGGSKVADIVAVKEVGIKPTKIAWVIECKKQVSAELMEQANYWISYADYVSVATWQRKNGFAFRANWLIRHAVRVLGIGLMTVSESGFVSTTNYESRLHREARRYNGRWHVHKYLTEQHKTACAAGGNEGGYFTPFRWTVTKLTEYVAANPGCSLKQAVESIEHHYSSNMCAKSSIAQWIYQGKIKSLRLETINRKLHVFVKEIAALPQEDR